MNAWQCPTCKRPGEYLLAVAVILRRDPADPALDEVQCLDCGSRGLRYDFKRRVVEGGDV